MAVEQVDLAHATREQIVTALKENGVADAHRWAAEIDTHRDAPQHLIATLREELAKRSIDGDTFGRILGTLGL